MTSQLELRGGRDKVNEQHLLIDSLTSDNIHACLEENISQKEKYLQQIESIGLYVPPRIYLKSNEINQTSLENAINQLKEKCEKVGIPLDNVIVRSAHPLEGKEGLSFSGVFESIKNVEAKPDSIFKAYMEIIKEDFRAIRYSKRNDIENFDMSDMGIIIMPMIDYEVHGMLRMRKKNEFEEPVYNDDYDKIIGSNIVICEAGYNTLMRKGNDYFGHPIKQDGTIYWEGSDEEEHEEFMDLENWQSVAKNCNRIVEHFQKPQEIELCIDKKGKIWILQSRDFDVIDEYKKEDDRSSQNHERKEKVFSEKMPCYVVDETEKDVEQIERELREFCLNHKDYILFLTDLSKSEKVRARKNNGLDNGICCSGDFGYGKYIESSTVCFAYSRGSLGASDHYTWRFNTPEFDDKTILVLYNRLSEHLNGGILEGKIDPKSLLDGYIKELHNINY